MTTEEKIILATRDETFEDRVRQAFDGALNGELTSWQEPLEWADPIRAVDAIANLQPDLVAIGPGVEFDEWVGIAQAFDRGHPEIAVVLVADPTPKLWEAALRSGVREVLAPKADDADVRAIFERALGTAVRRKENLLGGATRGPAGHVVQVMGPKGGVGKTTVSTNLAVGLATVAPRETVLVDLDLQFGDVAHALRLEPDRTSADALKAGADRDITTLKAFLTPHPSGLYVLCAPDSPAEVDEMEPERVARMVKALGEAFPFVVLDTGSGLDEFTLAAGEMATDFVLVAVTDVPSVRCMRKEVEALDQIGMTTQRRHFVLNRSDRQVGLSFIDIEETVGMSIDVAVPSSVVVTVSMNQGSPLLTNEEISPSSDALFQLVTRFAEVPADVASRYSKRRGKIR